MHLNLLDNVQAVFTVHHVDSKSSSAKAARATNPVQVRLIVCIPMQVHREVKIDHKGNLLHVNACNQHEHKQKLTYSYWPHGKKGCSCWYSLLPLEHTFVVTSTFSLPSLKRSMTAALCSTVISPLSSATW